MGKYYLLPGATIDFVYTVNGQKFTLRKDSKGTKQYPIENIKCLLWDASDKGKKKECINDFIQKAVSNNWTALAVDFVYEENSKKTKTVIIYFGSDDIALPFPTPQNPIHKISTGSVIQESYEIQSWIILKNNQGEK